MTAKAQSRPASISRALTSGELRVARSVFGTALNVGSVRVHNRPYFVGQGRRVAMTPNGEIWFRSEDYLPDFSSDLDNAAWLVHELTHAWQFQSGRSVRVRGFFEQSSRLFGADPYRYGELDATKPFLSFSNEQQAAIVEDYFRLTNGLGPRRGSGQLAAYRRVIPFLPRSGGRG